MINNIKLFIKSHSNIHIRGSKPDIFIFSVPRSGSTWLMQLIWSQKDFKCCDEPFNIRNPIINKILGLKNWIDLYQINNRNIIIDYLKKISMGEIKQLNPNPFGKYYRFKTNRTVFKIIHCCEDRINDIKYNLNSKIIFLLRHPIPVSLSRKILPRLTAFIESDYKNNLNENIIDYSKFIIKKGSHLEKGILSWCLQNYVPLNNKSEDWIVITYEQMILEPRVVFRYLFEKLKLNNLNKMFLYLNQPSSVVRQSDKKTQKFLNTEYYNRKWLIEKWKEKIDKNQEKKLMKILYMFNINAYVYGELTSKKFWIHY